MADECATPFLFLSANTPWVYALAGALAHDAPVHAVRTYDWRTYWHNRPTWPDPKPGADIRRTLRVLPTGYTGMLEGLVAPFMRYMVHRWREQLRDEAGAEPYVVAPYPYLAPWLKAVSDDRLIYYNLDDYPLYRPERRERIVRREDRLIQRAHLTLCLSQHQVDALRDRNPGCAERIVHFPLGVTEDVLNPQPGTDPEPRTVGYVGNLSDRVDWSFVNAVAERCPDLRFRFVGGADPAARDTSWERTRADAFCRDNVEHVGRVPQDAVAEYYWSFAVNWIPYDPEHPFNRASCPTKIMDGIASGRPVISTEVPECRLYPEWITIAGTAADASSALRTAARKSAEHDGQAQVAFARQHTWKRRAERFLSLTDAWSHAIS